MTNTYDALLARGLNSKKAESLANKGHTISSLKSLNKGQLTELGIPDFFIKNLADQKRSAIPTSTLHLVLNANAHTCCVCKRQTESIIIHHIAEWKDSKSHDSSNLAVLCLKHHDEAHTVKKLSQNLDANKISAAKKSWEDTVSLFAGKAVINAATLPDSDWLYFNHSRILKLASREGIDIDNWQSKSGYVSFADAAAKENYMYNSGDGAAMYERTKQLLHGTLQKITVVNVSDLLDKKSIEALLNKGNFIFVQGAHDFKSIAKKFKPGRGQTAHGSRKVNHVAFQFSFDLWEATSNSARFVWLIGRQSIGSLLQVHEIDSSNGKITIKCTVYAIAHGLDALKTRDYAAGLPKLLWQKRKSDEDDVIDEEDDPSNYT